MILEKYFLSFTLFYLLFIGTQGKSLSSSYNSHYEQHEQSVQAGRKSVEQRLSASLSSHPSSSYVDCALCSSGYKSGYQTGYQGGYVDSHGSANSHLSSSSNLLSSSHSSNLQHGSSSLLVPGRSDVEFQYHNRDSQHRVPISGELFIEPVQITVPSGGVESYSHHNEKHVQIGSSPVVVAPSGASENYRLESQRVMKAESTPILVAPSGTLESYRHERQRVMKAESTPILVAPSGTLESYRHERQRVMKAESTPILVTPSDASATYRHESQKVLQAQSPVALHTPTSNVNLFEHGSTGHHDYYTKYPSVQYRPSGSYSSEYNSRYVKNNQVSPVVTYTPSQPHSSSLLSETHSSANLAPINLGLGVSGLSTSSRGYSTGGVSSGKLELGAQHHSSLENYMSESERLARLQSQKIHNSGLLTGGTVVDADYGANTFSTSAGGNLGGGYVKSKSWEKSSKWASGSEYGPDGKPKSYNLLSTAEAEQHNLNGKQAGYKAATTTLDDNGKVSTYTIHTP